jgi:CheY-like chemotaxis protein
MMQMDLGTGRFLVVDDEAVVRMAYSRILGEAGHVVETAANGVAAIDALRQTHFDGVFADLRMPDMDGLEVTRLVRAEHPDTPVVIITGYPSRETALEAADLGVLRYQAKPITPDHLTDLAETVLEAGRASRDAEQPALAHPSEESTVEAEPKPVAAEAKPLSWPRRLLGLLQLAVSPLAGLAFFVLLPFIGIGMLLGLGAKAIGAKVALQGQG